MARIGHALEHQVEKQAKDYIDHGYHSYLHMSTGRFFDKFVSLYTVAGSKAEMPEGDMPILAVVPDAMINLNAQLELTGSRAFLRAQDMHNATKQGAEPHRPYALYGVSLGGEMRGVSADEAREQLRTAGRTGLNIIELVNLGLHAGDAFTVEGTRGRFAVETLHELDGVTTVIDLYRFGDGGLKVKRDPGHISDPQWTTPSYQERLVGSSPY